MRKLTFLIVALLMMVSSYAQKNFPVQKLENIIAVNIPDNSNYFFAFEGSNDGRSGDIHLVKRSLDENKIIENYSAKLPLSIFPLLVFDGRFVYFISKDEDSKPDAIYSFNLKKDKITQLLELSDEDCMPAWLEIIDGYLIIGSSAFKNQPCIFNINKKEMVDFSDNESLRMLCVSFKNSLMVVLDLSEAEDDPIPVRVKTVDGKVSNIVGYFDSSLSFSSEEDGENSQPGFKITDDSYNWISDAYNYGMYPPGGFGIAMKQKLSADYMTLAYATDMRLILAYNGKYLIGATENNVVVYNIENPVCTNPLTVDDETTSSIKEFLFNKLEHKVKEITSDSLSQVMDAQVYEVSTIEQIDEYSSTQKTFILIAKGDDYQVLTDVTQLLKYIASDFKLNNSENAVLFQGVLNSNCPPGTFEKKHIRFVKQDGSWIFLRDKSFNEYEAIIADVNESGDIIELVKVNDFKLSE